MARSRDEILHRHGYVALTEMREMLSRLCKRMEELDEPMTREYVLSGQSGRIEQDIRLMCQRRRSILTRLAEAELGRIANETTPAASAPTTGRHRH